jgi:uncharacterized protein YkwD
MLHAAWARPHPVGRRLAWALVGVLALGLGAAGAQGGEPAPAGRCPGADSASASAARQQAAMRCLINAARAAHGLPALRPSPALARAAALKERLMLACHQFAHTPCGRPWDGVFTQAGYRGHTRGENIAWASQSIASPRQVMSLWLHSPGHRANILRPGFVEQGLSVRVGVAFQGQARANLWTSQFGATGGAAAGRG